jgi:hypothetical protein
VVKHSDRAAVWLACVGFALAGCSDSGSPGAPVEASEVKVNTGWQWPPAPEGEDEPPVELAANPLASNYYVILDGSGSMKEGDCSRGAKIDEAKSALAEFANAVPDDANLGLLVFDEAGVIERLPLGAGQKDQFVARVNEVSAEAGTPLRSAIEYGYGALTRQALAQRGYGDYNLVIVTDGEASPGEDPTDIVAQILSWTPVLIHTIGFCIGEEHSLNQAGRTIYRAANNSAELRAGLGAVLAEAPSFDQTQL